MELDTISINKEDAVQKLAQYREAMKKDNSKELEQLSRLYRAAANGKRILDFYATMKAGGAALLNADGDPKIGIARIGWKRVRFSREASYNTPAMTYFNADDNRWRHPATKFDVTLPRETLPLVSRKDSAGQPIKNIETLVPMVPIEHRPTHPDSETLPYYILWEVEKWIPQAPKDPYLLRRASANLFIIEARWNTTKLERAFINGRVRV